MENDSIISYPYPRISYLEIVIALTVYIFRYVSSCIWYYVAKLFRSHPFPLLYKSVRISIECSWIIKSLFFWSLIDSAEDCQDEFYWNATLSKCIGKLVTRLIYSSIRKASSTHFYVLFDTSMMIFCRMFTWILRSQLCFPLFSSILRKRLSTKMWTMCLSFMWCILWLSCLHRYINWYLNLTYEQAMNAHFVTYIKQHVFF